MAWKKFPYHDVAYAYDAAGLKRAWKRLHAGDAEALPKAPALLDAWIAFHAGEFERAVHEGLELGIDGYAVANKASAIYAHYLESATERKQALFQAVAARCEQQQAGQPHNASGFYWHAYALGRYAQHISVMKALAEGIGGKIRSSLDATLKLAPRHADAHIALGTYHAEIVEKVGALVAGLTYGASRTESIRHFRSALELNPGSAIARVEYANALLMLEGERKADDATALYREAAASEPHDAMERLDVELAKAALEE